MSDPGVQPIGKVSLVRPGAVTHRFDQDQRFVELNIVQQVGSTLTLDAPDDANRAPPGYYMLFLISDAGVPSVASYVLLE